MATKNAHGSIPSQPNYTDLESSVKGWMERFADPESGESSKRLAITSVSNIIRVHWKALGKLTKMRILEFACNDAREITGRQAHDLYDASLCVAGQNKGDAYAFALANEVEYVMNCHMRPVRLRTFGAEEGGAPESTTLRRVLIALEDSVASGNNAKAMHLAGKAINVLSCLHFAVDSGWDFASEKMGKIREEIAYIKWHMSADKIAGLKGYRRWMLHSGKPGPAFFDPWIGRDRMLAGMFDIFVDVDL